MRGRFATMPGMRNIELKARLRDIAQGENVCKKIGAVYQGDIRQTDTYFNVPTGRLKLRENNPGTIELICYDRRDESLSKASDYEIVQARPELCGVLARALGVRCVVSKVRRLWLWHNVRIHLDTVENLGAFLEFEAVLGGTYDDADGHRTIEILRNEFGIASSELIECSYVDLLLRHASAHVVPASDSA